MCSAATRAQERLIHGDAPGAVGTGARRLTWRPAYPFPAPHAAAGTLRGAGTGVIVTGAAIVVAVASVGLLYQLRQLRWLALGPQVPDSLPLLQLAGFAGQPLARVLTASLVSGIALGIVLVRVPIARRTPAIALIAAALLLLASDASYALAQNLRFAHVLVGRTPGLGPWVQCTALAVGSALPAALSWAIANRSRFGAVERRPRRRTGAHPETTEICA